MRPPPIAMAIPIAIAILVAVPAAVGADGPLQVPAPTTPIDPLPPGAWSRDGSLRHVVAAPAPRYAAIAGTFASAAAAERAARRVDRTRVGPGYPWVVAQHDLRIAGRCRESIVVVTGLFASHGDALGWRAQDPSRARATIVALEH